MTVRIVRAWLGFAVALAVLASSACVPAPRAGGGSVATPATVAPSAPASASSVPSVAVEADASDAPNPDRAYVAALPIGRAVPVGDSQWSAILDAVRVVVERDLGQHVRFEVDTLRLDATFAAVSARPVTRNGSRIDYLHTHYAQLFREGTFDDGVLALLRKVDGHWRVIEWALGNTDYPGDYWLHRHHVQVNLFARG